MQKTGIPWTEYTWNPMCGCGAKCDYCYARKVHNTRHKAYKAGKKLPPQYAKPFEEIQLFPDRLEQPLHKRKSCMIFVDSVGDLFDPLVPFEFIDRIGAIIGKCPQHTFQVLTKRPERALEYYKYAHKRLSKFNPQIQPNLWLGVTAENQEQYDIRWPILSQIQATVRFISGEPLLSGLELCPHNDMQPDWVIVGGESGPGARPMHPDWPRNIRDQCRAAGVPFFFKQWGEWLPGPQAEYLSDEQLSKYKLQQIKKPVPGGTHIIYTFKVGKKKAGAKLDGKIIQEYPK